MTDLCKCGCGHPMPEIPPFVDVAAEVEAVVVAAGYTMAQLKRHDRRRILVDVRAEVARYLRAHDWSFPRIGEFLGRDHATVMRLLRRADELAQAREPAA